tara:strand:+ start:399 stop:647 length:249 start_codon:yes stop_codon:yes gene_type:complete
MFKWLKKYNVKEEKKEKVIRCEVCWLKAHYHMQIRFQRFGEKPMYDKIIIRICSDCYEEVYERYNPQRLPAPVQTGVFEKTD